MAARTRRAPTEAAQLRVWIDAAVRVRPRDGQASVRALDVRRPRHRRRQALELRAPSARTATPQRLERIDRAMVVGPRDAEGIPADEMHVTGDVGIRLAED